jgi:ribulose-bisphosphate carboxylase large chain
VLDIILPVDEERIFARYWIESALALEQAAEIMAGEQSTGTFIQVPGETAELRDKHAARVERIIELDSVETPSLPGAAKSKATPAVYKRAEVTLSWPLSNMGPSLPNVLATVAGNLFELKPFSGLKLLDVTLTASFLDRYPGPQFGVAGTRDLCGVARPAADRHHHQTERRVIRGCYSGDRGGARVRWHRLHQRR